MSDDPSETLVNAIKNLRKALFMCAASCQGGNSEAGMTASRALGVPFPIRMHALKAKAVGEGFNPDELWPWLGPMQRRES